MNELDAQIKYIDKKISQIERGEMEDEVLVGASKEFLDGYIDGLMEQKSFLLNLIINYGD